MMDKRLNTIITDYGNINQQIQHLRCAIPIDQYPNKHLAKSAFLKNRKGSNRNKYYRKKIKTGKFQWKYHT